MLEASAGDECKMLLKDSAIKADQIHIEDWVTASGTTDQCRSWSRERALAFQRAVERRAAHLYQSYCSDTGFSKWR